jgi:hypothetical protein
MHLRTTLKVLLTLAIGLPVLEAVLVWAAGLLAATGDAAAASVLRQINVAAGVLWILTLVAIVIALAVKAVLEPLDIVSEDEEPPLL